MEISLPPYKAFVDGIVDGPITVLRMPKGTVKNGDTVTAKVSGVYPEAVKSGSGTLNIHCCMASRSRKPNGRLRRAGFLPLKNPLRKHKIPDGF